MNLILLLILYTGLVGAGVLEIFQVAQPPSVPHDAKQCTVEVFQRDFASSYGRPEIVHLVPPIDCGEPGSWAAITLNFTVTSNGTQFDRLGIFTLRNVEIWRTSTPEPIRGDGIIWSYIKDVTRYMPLFARPGPLILQLDNTVQVGLDGVYSTTLQATYYASSTRSPPAKRADLIIPLSTLSVVNGNEVSVPPAFSINVTIPRNTVQVYAEIYASGNAHEEFWHFNVLDQLLSKLPADRFDGKGPFREIRLLVGGQVAGIVFPYPVIFSGAFVPSAWRPIMPYGALDLPTYFLDLTPFVPILVDGLPHQITFDVVSGESARTILQNWFISGSLQVIQDESPYPTQGRIISYEADPYAQSTVAETPVADGGLMFWFNASHYLRVESQILSGSGTRIHVVWNQNFTFQNAQTYKNNATRQILHHSTQGQSLSLHNGITAVKDICSYPLDLHLDRPTPDPRTWKTSVDHAYNRNLLPSPLLAEHTITTHQKAGGFAEVTSTKNIVHGYSQNEFVYFDTLGNTYTRRANSVSNQITLDDEGGSLAPTTRIRNRIP